MIRMKGLIINYWEYENFTYMSQRLRPTKFPIRIEYVTRQNLDYSKLRLNYSRWLNRTLNRI